MEKDGALKIPVVAVNDAALIPLYHQLVTWAMKKHLFYAARTDEFTFAGVKPTLRRSFETSSERRQMASTSSGRSPGKPIMK